MWYLYAVALAAGIANAIQPGQSTQLGKSLGDPFTAALASMIVGVATILTAGLLAGRLHLPSGEEVAAVPWWAWFGGLLGAGVVLAQLFVAHRIGAAPFVGLIVTAAVVTSIALDHFGLIGFAVHPASLWRVLGGLLMIGGVALVAAF